MSISVCLSVCQSVCTSVCLREHISETTVPNFTKFYVHVTCGGRSVLVCRRCYTLCTSRFFGRRHVFPSWLCLWWPIDATTATPLTTCCCCFETSPLCKESRGRSLWRTVALWCLYVTEIHCLPVDIRNASLSSGGTRVGSAVNVTCQPGYKIDGQTGATLHCSSSGKWTPANLTCQRQWLIISSLCRT